MTQPLDRPEERPAVDAVAGLLAAAAIAVAIIGIAYRPARLTPVATVVALVAAAMSPRWRTLSGVAVAVCTLAWFVGMLVAVLTRHPLY